MSRAAIAVDDYKVKLFKEELTAAGYEYTEGEISGIAFLFVETDDLIKIGYLVEEMNNKALRNKMN